MTSHRRDRLSPAAGLYGKRNDQPAAYAAFVPPRHRDEEGLWVGGLFWDGRANTLAEQAQGPPLNPLEMANPDVETIAAKRRALDYAAARAPSRTRGRRSTTWPTRSRPTSGRRRSAPSTRSATGGCGARSS